MRYGFVLPRGDARTAADLAYQAERAGWDGFFVWEPVWGTDAWIALAAAWWIEAMWSGPRRGDWMQAVRQRIEQGPPG